MLKEFGILILIGISGTCIAGAVNEMTSTGYDSARVFTTDQCPWCERFKPEVAKAVKHGYRIETTHSREGGWQPKLYPTTLYYKDGKVVETRTGFQPYQSLVKGMKKR